MFFHLLDHLVFCILWKLFSSFAYFILCMIVKFYSSITKFLQNVNIQTYIVNRSAQESKMNLPCFFLFFFNETNQAFDIE